MKKHDTLIKVNTELYSLMRDLRISTEASRVLVLSCHNGGSVPDVGTRNWVSVLHESVSDSSDSVINYKHRADESTVKLLNKIWVEGQCWATPEEIDEGSQIKFRWEADGTKDVLFFLIAIVPNKETFFGSVEFKHRADIWGVNFIDTLNTYIAGVRDLFEKRGYKRVH